VHQLLAAGHLVADHHALARAPVVELVLELVLADQRAVAAVDLQHALEEEVFPGALVAVHDHRRAQLGARVLQWIRQPAHQPVEDLVALVGVVARAAGEEAAQLEERVDVALTSAPARSRRTGSRTRRSHVSVGSNTTSFGMIVRRVSERLPHLDHVAAVRVRHVAIFMIMRLTPSHTVSVP
jgi:hypothetical protein